MKSRYDLITNNYTDIIFDVNTNIEFDRICKELGPHIKEYNTETFTFKAEKYELNNEEYTTIDTELISEKNMTNYFCKRLEYKENRENRNIENLVDDRSKCQSRTNKLIKEYMLYSVINVKCVIEHTDYNPVKYKIVLQFKITGDKYNYTLAADKSFENVLKIVLNTQIIYTSEIKFEVIKNYNSISKHSIFESNSKFNYLNGSKELLTALKEELNSSSKNLSNCSYMCHAKEGFVANLFVDKTGVWIISANRISRFTNKIDDIGLIGTILSGKLLKEKICTHFEIYELLSDHTYDFSLKMKKRNEYVDNLLNKISIPGLTVDVCNYLECKSNHDSTNEYLVFKSDTGGFVKSNKPKNMYLKYEKGDLYNSNKLFCKEGIFNSLPILSSNFNYKYNNAIIEFKIIHKNGAEYLIPVTYRFDRTEPSSCTKLNYQK